jgi:glucose 1-dehydrogenase
MQALVTTPGKPSSTRVTELSDPRPGSELVRIQTLEVGVCGTDREIVAGRFGTAPAGSTDLVLGHELLGAVLDDGQGFSRGELVTASVRRGCRGCSACDADQADSCLTGEYLECGITGRHGFARELVVEHPEHLVVIPGRMREVGVLAEPASVCARAIRHSFAVGRRQPWEVERVLVLGAGAIGLLATYLLRIQDLPVCTMARPPRGSRTASLIEACGAHYASADESSIASVAAEFGGFDLVIEATGVAQVMGDALATTRRNGVICLLGVDATGTPIQLPGHVLGIDMVVRNLAVLGSVNATPSDWRAGIAGLDAMLDRWPDATRELVGYRCAPDSFADALAFDGVKATLQFATS